MAARTVSIVVLNYNGKHFLSACLEAVFAQSYKAIEVIVVDNNSTDGSVEFLERYPNVRLVKNPENYGYAKANNIGARAASGEFLLILNNDTELFPDMVEKLVGQYVDRSILSPCQLVAKSDKKVHLEICGIGVDVLGCPSGDKDFKKTRAFYVDGSAIFIKKDDFVQIGMFDEELFIFYEDIDLSWRAQMMGYSIRRCWDARYYHYSGGTVTGGYAGDKPQYRTTYRRRFLNERNALRNLLKNYSGTTLCFLLPVYGLIWIAENAALLALFQRKIVACHWEAVVWNVRHLRDTLSLRAKIQRIRTVSDFAVMKNMYWSYGKLLALWRVGWPQFN